MGIKIRAFVPLFPTLVHCGRLQNALDVVSLEQPHIATRLWIRNRYSVLFENLHQYADRSKASMVNRRAGPIENDCLEFLAQRFISAIVRSASRMTASSPILPAP